MLRLILDELDSDDAGDTIDRVVAHCHSSLRARVGYRGFQAEHIGSITNQLWDLLITRLSAHPHYAWDFLRFMKNNAGDVHRSAGHNLGRVLSYIVDDADVLDFFSLVRRAREGVEDGGAIPQQLLEGLRDLCIGCCTPQGVQGTHYQLKILELAADASGDAAGGGWRKFSKMERRIADAETGFEVRGMDIELADNHQGYRIRDHGADTTDPARKLEVKSGPTLTARQNARHLYHYRTKLKEVRFVINTRERAELMAASNEIWTALRGMFHGDTSIPAHADNADVARRMVNEVLQLGIGAADVGPTLRAAPADAVLQRIRNRLIIAEYIPFVRTSGPRFAP